MWGKFYTLIAERCDFRNFSEQNEWKVVRRWHHQLTNLLFFFWLFKKCFVKNCENSKCCNFFSFFLLIFIKFFLSCMNFFALSFEVNLKPGQDLAVNERTLTLCLPSHLLPCLPLKEHCTQKKIWIHLMQNIFRNQTVKNLTILDNPFKRYDFSKFSLNSVKSYVALTSWQLYHVMGAQLPIGFVHRLSQIFNFLGYE